jgi:hypothetical protein
MEYQVLRVKPDDLEAALNEMARGGWQVQSIIPAALSGRQMFARQTLSVDVYHVVFYREEKKLQELDN